jgi:predicted nuclease of predicted toxin-antitoxin system
MLRYLIDENLRGRLWHLIERHNALGIYPIDALRVGDIADLPLRSSDPDIIQWSAQNDRILVTLDKSTIPVFFQEHLQQRHHPGVFLLSRHDLMNQVLDFLVMAAYASDPAEWQDAVRFIP